MRVELKPHPESSCAAVSKIEVELWRTQSEGLVLRYVAAGKIQDLQIPPFAHWTRADGLWQHTCFEAFIRPAGGQAYCELNFSPSSQWAGYTFDRYRDGMREARELRPQVEMKYGAGFYELRACIGRDQLVASSLSAPWRLALCAVIEEIGGEKSYWALAHPPGKPDFHHADGFALELP
ncbi:MAG: DOMON-like domain-containing protein [Terricaulis sp.]